VPLEDDDAANRGVGFRLDDWLRPVGIGGLEVAPVVLDDELFEGGGAVVRAAHDEGAAPVAVYVRGAADDADALD